MKTFRANPTPLQRFLKQENFVEGEITNFLFDEDGKTVYAEYPNGWLCIFPNFKPEKAAPII